MHSKVMSADQQMGSFQISATLKDLLEGKSLETYTHFFNHDELLSWEVYISSNYDVNNPPGLMVYISPTNSGEIPENWKSLMLKYNLIWVSAHHSGNSVESRKRLILAVLASSVINKKYPISLKRVYVSGLSGGGRMASIAASQFPELFKGAIYNSGVNFWNNISKQTLEKIKQNRFVFITGRNDFNLEDTKRVFRKYKKAGIKNIKLLINPTMGHFNPDKKDFETAINYLDNK